MIVIPRRQALDAWEGERQRCGLILRNVEIGEDFEITFVLEAETVSGEEVHFDDELMPSQVNTGPLAKRLAAMLDRAKANPGQPQRETLVHGLRVDLIVGLDGMTRLLLAREKVYPSDIEWNTVLSHWPYPVVVGLDKERFEHKTWRCLRAAWPTPQACH